MSLSKAKPGHLLVSNVTIVRLRFWTLVVPDVCPPLRRNFLELWWVLLADRYIRVTLLALEPIVTRMDALEAKIRL